MFKPLHDYVLLEKVEAEKMTASGIILSEIAKEQPTIGLVSAVGEGKMIDGKVWPMSVSPGNRVVYKKYAGTEVKLDDKNYVLVSENDILGIIE